MRRGLRLLWVLAAVISLAAIGCEQKITKVEKTEQVHESDPQMVSPGETVVE